MISKFREAYDNRHLIAREWKKSGRKVFGYFYSFVPEEIIYAGGILPVQLTESAERESTSKGETFLPEYFCDFVHSCLGQGVDGIYNYLDGIVIPDACVPFRTLAEVWDIHVKTPVFVYLNYPSEAYDGSRAFLLAEFSKLKKAVEKVSGKEVSAQYLRSAIEVYNENRNLLKRLYELRQKDNPPLSGSEFFEIFRAGLVIPKEEHNKMLKDLMSHLPAEGKRRTGKRLMISAPIFEEVTFDRPNFIRVIEELGGDIVTDDLTIGFRYYWALTKLQPNLMEGIVDRYLGKVPIAYKVTAQARAEMLLNEALKHKVSGAIFFIPKYCQSSNFHIPYIEEKFREKGIGTLQLESTSEMPEAPLRTRIQAFLEMLP